MSDRANILVPGDDPPQIAGSPQLERLQAYGDVTLHSTRPADKAEQIERARGFEVVINSRGSVTWREEELRSLSDLRMITTCSIGTDMIDLAAACQLGVVVSNQPGRTAPVVAEHMFGLLFTVAKRAAFQTAEIRDHRWTRRMNLGVQGKVLGIVGTGNIGAEMARLAQAAGIEEVVFDRRGSKYHGRVKAFADAAREAGIVIGIENHQDICSHELVGLCQQIGGDHIGVTMDVGNAYAVGETPATFARRVGPFLKHVHLKDYTVHPTKSGYRLKRCALGDGIVDWKSMLPWFDSQCPLVAGCIELGATSARHIRLFEPGWWQTYPERDFVPDAIEALGDLQRAAQPSATDWRTPHEAGESAPVCADYEIDQIERSGAYLKEIGAV